MAEKIASITLVLSAMPLCHARSHRQSCPESRDLEAPLYTYIGDWHALNLVREWVLEEMTGYR